MNKLLRTIILISIVATFATIATGCSHKKAAPSIDKEMTQQLKNEKNVVNGQVYFQGSDLVIATMVMKDGTTLKNAKTLAQDYANKLKAKYKDKKVNVQAVDSVINLATVSK